MIDGNLAALAAHERDLDAAETHMRHIESIAEALMRGETVSVTMPGWIRTAKYDMKSVLLEADMRLPDMIVALLNRSIEPEAQSRLEDFERELFQAAMRVAEEIDTWQKRGAR